MKLNSLRIAAVIAAKDLADAVRSRTMLSIVIGTLTLMLSSMALPLLIRINAVPTAVVYDPQRTTVVRALTTREEFRLLLVDSRDELLEAVGGSSEPRLGLIIPEGFASGSGTEQTVALEGYVSHRVSDEEAAALAATFENELTEASWQQVRIDISPDRAFPSKTAFGQHTMIANTTAIATLTLGLALVPGLLIEEKEHHTLEALLVSPARYRHVVLGKAIAGAVYCATAAAIAVALNAVWFVHGWLAALAIGSGTAFAVAVGLLIGLLVDNPASTNLWVGLIFFVLATPAFLGTLVDVDMAGIAPMLIRWIPTSAIGRQLELSMTETPRVSEWLMDTIRLWVSTVAVVGAIIWRLRRLEA